MEVKNMLGEFKKSRKLYGKRLKQVILYGSWARGDATEESDIDVIIVLS